MRTSQKGHAYEWHGYLGMNSQYEIVGTSYRPENVQDLFSEKNSGTMLLLMKEPGNKADSNAVAIYSALNMEFGKSFDWVKVGYLPKYCAHGEFAVLPPNTILEARKVSDKLLRLTGNVRVYS